MLAIRQLEITQIEATVLKIDSFIAGKFKSEESTVNSDAWRKQSTRSGYTGDLLI
jgi:hypothetical protein